MEPSQFEKDEAIRFLDQIIGSSTTIATKN